MLEYNEQECLKTMFEMQESLQNAIGAKRGTICPNSWNLDIADKYRTMAIESGYYFLSTTTEFFEFIEQLEKDNFQFTDLVKFELIDAWHFCMNQLLYFNIHPTQTLQWYYDKAKKNLEYVTFVNHDLQHLIGEYCYATGELMQNSSYKKWKNYDTPKEDPLKMQELGDALIIKFMQICVAIRMKPEEIWKFYYEKNAENFKRQEKGRNLRKVIQ